MLTHHALVAAVCALGACLPVRLGTWAESEEEARGLLAAREEALVAALARVEGKVEVAVAWLWREGATETPGRGGPGTRAGDAGTRRTRRVGRRPGDAGTRYLLQRRLEIARRDERAARARELAALVERAAGVAGTQAQHRLCPSEAVALSSALLVERAGADAAIARVRAAASGLADVEPVVNGPWPPYSFAGI